MQGDIVEIYSSAGVKLVTYKYDAWGKTTVAYSNNGASTTAVKNNLTYRDYYYDILYIHDKANPSQHSWGRTVISMLVEWDVHNHIHFVTKYERVAHTDFDKNDENTRYFEYCGRAAGSGVGMIIDWIGGLFV